MPIKGTKSKTHKGDKNYTTKRGDTMYHRKHHNVKGTRSPYSAQGGGIFSILMKILPLLTGTASGVTMRALSKRKK
jgi:hypothetical protein